MALRTFTKAYCCSGCGCGAPDPCCDGTMRSPGTRRIGTRRALGHTAFHHVGLGDYSPSPSSPYYRFGVQRRAPYNWAGGAGGTPWQNRRSNELGNADLRESGLEAGAYLPFPAFRRTILHDPAYYPTGDWPLYRPQGPEPVGLSDNEKKLGMVLALGAVGLLIWKKMGKAGRPGSRRLARATRRLIRNPGNPVPFKYQVVASTKRRGRGRRRRGAIGFTSKRAAEDYADYLRKGGHKAKVRKK